MNYRGYEISETKDGIIIEDIKDFNPVHIFECGQSFRWHRQEDGSYTGVAKGKVANVSASDHRLLIKGASMKDLDEVWFDYFDLGRDYGKLKAFLIKKDEVMKKAVEFGEGMRIIRQDMWEMLISFIISANNRIPMIMKVVGDISKMYGEKIEFSGKTFYSFPQPASISVKSLEELSVCKAGFRCKYIIETARMVQNGDIDIYSVGNLETAQARETLKKFPGVGDKVADCVLLSTGTKYDVFPTDVWVKRVMEELYFKREASLSEIQAFAREYFGEIAGLAQQYLFYYARENKIGTK